MLLNGEKGRRLPGGSVAIVVTFKQTMVVFVRAKNPARLASCFHWLFPAVVVALCLWTHSVNSNRRPHGRVRPPVGGCDAGVGAVDALVGLEGG